MKISLKQTIEYLDLTNDRCIAFLDTKTGTFHHVELELLEDLKQLTDEELSQKLEEAPEWQQQELLLTKELVNSENYIELPGKLEKNEYGVIKEFIESQDDEDLREELYSSIRRKGAFRRFKDKVEELGIRDDWFTFQQESYAWLMLKWGRHNKIKFEDDRKKS